MLDEVISLLKYYHLELSPLALEANVRDSEHMMSGEAKSSFFKKRMYIGTDYNLPYSTLEVGGEAQREKACNPVGVFHKTDDITRLLSHFKIFNWFHNIKVELQTVSPRILK